MRRRLAQALAHGPSNRLVTEVAVQVAGAPVVPGHRQLDVLDATLPRLRFGALHEEPPQLLPAGLADDAHGGDLEDALAARVAGLCEPEMSEIGALLGLEHQQLRPGHGEPLRGEALAGEPLRPAIAQLAA